ncbi:MAG: hypothetical protein M5U22_09665 [Thermoleophilia bacterium]|nr:hypothetical protein [Thermoleophilia bacterium]
MLLLMFPQIGCHGTQIVAKLLGVFLAKTSRFFNDWIGLHG